MVLCLSFFSENMISAVQNRYQLFNCQLLTLFHGFHFIYVFTGLPLSTAQLAFEYNGLTFSSCLLAHRLVVMGFGEELVQRGNELSAKLLSHAGEVAEKISVRSKMTRKVSNSSE